MPTDTFDLFFYPPGGGFEGRDWRGSYDTPEQAADASPYPDLADWDTTSEGRYDTSSQRIIADERDYQPYSIDHRTVQGPRPDVMELRIVRGGEAAVMVDAAAYAAAKNAGTVPAFLADHIAATPVLLTLVEPTGGLVNLPTGSPE